MKSLILPSHARAGNTSNSDKKQKGKGKIKAMSFSSPGQLNHTSRYTCRVSGICGEITLTNPRKYSAETGVHRAPARHAIQTTFVRRILIRKSAPPFFVERLLQVILQFVPKQPPMPTQKKNRSDGTRGRGVGGTKPPRYTTSTVLLQRSALNAWDRKRTPVF